MEGWEGNGRGWKEVHRDGGGEWEGNGRGWKEVHRDGGVGREREGMEGGA